MNITRVEDHAGQLLAVFADGSTYVVDRSPNETSAISNSILAQIASGTLKVVSPVENVPTVIAYYSNRIDEIATQRMQTTNLALSELHRYKLEEARDVIDMLETSGNRDDLGIAAEDARLRYPILAASGGDIVATARQVQARAIDQRQHLTTIETWRLASKAALRSSQSRLQAQTAFASALSLISPKSP